MDKPIPPEELICKCGHSSAAHLSNGIRKMGANNPTYCTVRFCICSRYIFNNAK